LHAKGIGLLGNRFIGSDCIGGKGLVTGSANGKPDSQNSRSKFFR
jgi:hypothetical protein